MPRQKKTHCIRGHEFTLANTHFDTLANGYVVRKCRACRAVYDRMRYRNNEKRRESVRRRARRLAKGRQTVWPLPHASEWL